MKFSFLIIFEGGGAGLKKLATGDFCAQSGLPQLGVMLVIYFFGLFTYLILHNTVNLTIYSIMLVHLPHSKPLLTDGQYEYVLVQ